MTELTRKDIGHVIDTAHMLKLRRDGHPIAHIAGVMKMSPIACLAAINDALKELQGDSREYADQIREIELQRLDLATQALMPAVEKGSHDDIDMLLRVQKRRSAYLGLDGAQKTDAVVRIIVDAPWLSPDRLSYQRDAVDVTPIESQPQSWKEAEARELTLVKASDMLPAPDSRTIANPSGPNATPKRAG